MKKLSNTLLYWWLLFTKEFEEGDLFFGKNTGTLYRVIDLHKRGVHLEMLVHSESYLHLLVEPAAMKEVIRILHYGGGPYREGHLLYDKSGGRWIVIQAHPSNLVLQKIGTTETRAATASVLRVLYSGDPETGV